MPASRRPKPWWGDGLAPHLQWPNVTIELPAVWSSTRRRWESPDGRYWFDQTAADRAEDFFPTFLRHHRNHITGFAGDPFTLMSYQVKLLTRPLFGWKRTSDNLRRFRKVMFFAPKGAGKSPWGAGTALYLTLFDAEPGAEVYALARDIEQARVVHHDAQLMIETAPELAAQCEVLKDSIFVPSTRSTFKVLSADATGHHGWRPHAVVIDELQQQRTRDQMAVASKSMAKRRQPVLVMMAHAGTDTESVAYEELTYAKNLLSGQHADEQLLPVVFEMAPSDDWKSEAVWRRVNPGYGVTVQPDAIAQQAHEAANEPRKLNDFLRFQLNVWTNQATAWLPVDWWDACSVPNVSIPALVDYLAVGALDMAQRIDYASFVVSVRIPAPLEEPAPAVPVVTDTGLAAAQSLDYRIVTFPFYWLPEDVLLEREQMDGLPLSMYADRGLLFRCPGATISGEQVARDIIEKIAPQFARLRTIGYDPAFAADVSQRLATFFETIEIPQTYQFMTAPCYTLEALVKSQFIAHAGHPILRWNVANVEVKRDDAGRLRPVKPRVTGSHRRRIDGVVALLMTLGILSRQAPTPQYSLTIF